MTADISLTRRKKHAKSRTGCQCCKARRVKCDEQQPRCGNCKARKTECVYQNHRVVTVQAGGKLNIAKGPDFSISSPLAATVKLEDLTELKLLHHWSTQTYKSLITPSNNDQDVWQSRLPQVAFRCEYLLHGVYALSAFDLARASQSEYNEWIALALQYQDQAFQGFRKYFSDESDAGHEAAMYFSLLITVLSFASHQVTWKRGTSDGLMDNMAMYYELIRGTQVVLSRNLPFFRRHPLFCNIKTIDQIPQAPIALTTRRVLELLTDENEKASTEGSLPGTSLHRKGCSEALVWLEKCFATCLDPYYQMYCEAWVPLAGENYFVALKARDRIALLILACWATLFQRLGENAWWAKDYGRELVAEIVLYMSEDSLVETRWILSWAQDEISFPT